MTPKVLIIIVNWNGKEYLSDCLRYVHVQKIENIYRKILKNEI
jgi:GT2 family glycosyltransferase